MNKGSIGEPFAGRGKGFPYGLGANPRREDGGPDGGEGQGEESDSEDETETTEVQQHRDGRERERKRERDPEDKEPGTSDRPKRSTAGNGGPRDIGDIDSEDDDWRDSTEIWIRDRNGTELEANGKMVGWPEFLKVRGVHSINLEGFSEKDKISWRKRCIRKLY